ncbi:hypothetical protein EDB86DRAFT_3088116 [Lactarius hatsudake]|nr:hypothetical protein EDB86DRAFT_3088116 [Lactarius hatsudake]
MVSENVFHQRGITLLHRTFNLMIQSLLYGEFRIFISFLELIRAHCSGIYASLFPVSAYIMIQKGLRSLSQKVLFGVIVFMFSLSTAYLAVTFADLITIIKTWYLAVDPSDSTDTRSPMETLLVLFNAFAPINYSLTDGVVVWRAWIICRDESRKLLRAPIVMLVLTMLGVLATIGIRIFISIDPVNRDKGGLAETIDVFQEITLISSLITNVLGTGIISLKAWRYRRWIVADLQRVVNKRTKAERVMGLLVESGILYVFSGVMLVVSSLVHLPGPHIMLGSLYTQAAVHLAGMYPVIVVILVNRESSMDKTLFNSTLPVIITDLQQASSQFRAGQTAARQVKSTDRPMASLQLAAAQGPRPTRDSLDSSSLGSLSSSVLRTDVDLSENGIGVD